MGSNIYRSSSICSPDMFGSIHSSPKRPHRRSKNLQNCGNRKTFLLLPKDISVQYRFFKGRGVVHLFSLNETKASYAERVIKTIKMRIYRHMLKTVSYRYLDVLQDIVQSYNHTQHRMLGQSPDSVTKRNEGEVRLAQYLIKKSDKSPKKKSNFTFEAGDKVRISHLKGTFYAFELQKVTENPDQVYKIQEVLKKRTRNKQKEVLIKWLHRPSKYNLWIPETDLIQYQMIKSEIIRSVVTDRWRNEGRLGSPFYKKGLD
ncbi:uncharacterized protein LOC121385927 [Gigantopelta aegis]|uniref:uncharacterized protein LOC121385927 n=1 Tax=Gigantopelta aegis TaxID=1735272 RepID=UPI001B887EFC|nr:uncharacterized protein LOC121385927 [Gigantopelta aegis]